MMRREKRWLVVVAAVFGVVGLMAPSPARADHNAATRVRPAAPAGIRVSTFPAEVRATYTTADGLPNADVAAVAVDHTGNVYAGTAAGLARFHQGRWERVTDYRGPVRLLAASADGLIGAAASRLYVLRDGTASVLAPLPEGDSGAADLRCLIGGPPILLGTSAGLFELKGQAFAPVPQLDALLGGNRAISQVARAADGRIAVAAAAGLLLYTPGAGWRPLLPQQGSRSWAPRDVRGVAFDSQERLWFASPQGVGMLDGEAWTLYTGYDGLPYNDFSCVTAGADGAVWFGTRLGAIRFDGRTWRYRMAPRWLPDNAVRSIAVQADGTSWFATAQGVGAIRRPPMTLADKARLFERDVDQYHRRTPFGFVHSVRLQRVADQSAWDQTDSDNDGLWTSMYGAGECFAYGATRDAQAKQRATAAFEAVRFLSQVTQGGSHPAPPGFPARTILPTSGRNPNESEYTADKDREKQHADPLWKVIVPRWPTSADGHWYWKCDTSSDELDGHYFLYAVYYDLVAETAAERQRVRAVVAAITDHLIEHNFQLVDHDGKPTRWGRFSPEVLNGDVLKGCRGLNSLSILSYLKVAEYMTGDPKYRRAYDTLVETHSYATNTLDPKRRTGVGMGNQSDEEMAFMCYYNLIRYERDPRLRSMYLWSLRWYWLLEYPERCPLFNFIYAALDDGSEMPFLWPPEPAVYLADAVDTLARIPVDRLRWSYQNSHRLDIVEFPATSYRVGRGGHLRTGMVIPVDERDLEYWNQDPWSLDAAHDGTTLTDGAAFLLAYYLGLYHGLIVEQPAAPPTPARPADQSAS